MVAGAGRPKDWEQVALAAKDTCEESSTLAGTLRGIGIAGAAFVTRHVGHDLLDVLTASGPGDLAALAAGGGATHGTAPHGGDGVYVTP